MVGGARRFVLCGVHGLLRFVKWSVAAGLAKRFVAAGLAKICWDVVLLEVSWGLGVGVWSGLAAFGVSRYGWRAFWFGFGHFGRVWVS